MGNGIEQLNYNSIENKAIYHIALDKVRKTVSRFNRVLELSDMDFDNNIIECSLEKRFMDQYNVISRDKNVVTYFANSEFMQTIKDDIVWLSDDDETHFGYVSGLDRVYILCAPWINQKCGISMVQLTSK